MKNKKIQRMTGLAMLIALSAILQVVAIFLKFGTVSITLSLIPIVIASIIYGPGGGALVGLAMGVVTIIDPTTATFIAFSPVATVIVCLVKSAMAGVVAGLIYKALHKKSFALAVIIASISAPIVNTGLFSLACIFIFKDLIVQWAAGSGGNYVKFIFLTMIGVNFLIEFAVNSILSPTVVRIIRIFNKNFGRKEIA